MYGTALRWRVVFLDVMDHLWPQQIGNVLKVGKTFVHGILKLYRETKGVDYLPNPTGMQCSVTGKCRWWCLFLLTSFLLTLLQHFIFVFQQEKFWSFAVSSGNTLSYIWTNCDWILFLTGESYSISMLSRYLCKIGLSVKKVGTIVFMNTVDLRLVLFRGMTLHLQMATKMTSCSWWKNYDRESNCHPM